MKGTWLAVLVTACGCYGLKLAGLTVPERVLAHSLVRRTAELLPIALLTALAVIQVAVSQRSLTFDPARLAGFGAAALALLARAPFLVVIVVAAATAALARVLGVS